MNSIRVICAVGGSGSTYLAKLLSQKYQVSRKPDAIFRSSFELGPENSDDGFVRRHFKNRGGGFESPNTFDPNAFASDLSEFLRDNSNHVAILNTLHELGLMGVFADDEIAFLIRDPLPAYLSFYKPERHGRIASALGGIYSRASQLFFARKWNALADEILYRIDQGKTPKIIMYESLDNDLIRLGLIDSVTGFTPNQKTFDPNDEKLDLYLRLTLGRYEQITNSARRVFETHSSSHGVRE